MYYFELTYFGFVQLRWSQEPYNDVELAKAHTNEGVQRRKLTELIVFHYAYYLNDQKQRHVHGF